MQDPDEGIDAASAYIVLFAVDSASSFATAKDVVSACREQHGDKAAVLLVANKTDLVRRRVVSCHGWYSDVVFFVLIAKYKMFFLYHFYDIYHIYHLRYCR